MKLDSVEIDFLHRIKYAQPLKNNLEFELFKSKIDFNNFDKCLLIDYVGLFQGSVEDIEGCLRSHDLLSAISTSRIAVDRIFEAYMCSLGETNPRSKWLMRKINRSGNDELLNIYLKLQTPPKVNREDVTTYVYEVLDFCSNLSVISQQCLKEK